MMWHDNIVHVYPVKDLREHVVDNWSTKGNCGCLPMIEHVRDGSGRIVGMLVTHNAFDKREVKEARRVRHQ